MTPQGTTGGAASVGAQTGVGTGTSTNGTTAASPTAPTANAPVSLAASSLGDQLGKIGQTVPNAVGTPKLGGQGQSAAPQMSQSPFAQGFAGATAAQQGNPNMGGLGTMNSEVQTPGVGFLSGLLSGGTI